MDTVRVLLYSHDSLGLGHVRRNLVIAHHLARHLPEATGAQVSGLLVSGLADASRFELPQGFDWLTIPGVQGTFQGYQPRRLPGAISELITLRSRLLQAALLGFSPDLVIVDRHIYGVWKELHEPLLGLRAMHPGAKVVLGLREVLDDPQLAAAAWERLGSTDELRRIVDEVWVYGDPAIHDPVLSGEITPALADRIRFTGYLASDRRGSDDSPSLSSQPFVLTTVGGGSDGQDLLRAAVAMRPPAGHQNIVVTGPQLDDAEFAAIVAQAGPDTVVHRSWPGLGKHIAEAAAVIAMGGYNTACEILATDTPALIVPRETPTPEQLIRAQALSEARAVDLMRAPRVTTVALETWVADAVTRRVERSHIQRDGLAATAVLGAQLLSDDDHLNLEAVA
ncbi:MAG: glycosyltransferase [Propionibacteriaceae bacterium]|nr:glycosyltransferase [Propionibacteriaceae bacterium]